MSYLLDADVLISAKQNHYRFGTFPCFWDWIIAANASRQVYSVDAVKDEVTGRGDDLSLWAGGQTGLFLSPDATTIARMPEVSAWASHPDRNYTEQAVATFMSKADYWLVGAGLARADVVVTHEAPDPNSKKRVKIPDVCVGLGVQWMSPYQMLEQLGAQFR